MGGKMEALKLRDFIALLVGKRFLITYETGDTFEVYYKSRSELLWKAVGGPTAGSSGKETIHAVEAAPKVFFLSWLEKTGISVSQLLDLNTMQVTTFMTFDAKHGRQSIFMNGKVQHR